MIINDLADVGLERRVDWKWENEIYAEARSDKTAIPLRWLVI